MAIENQDGIYTGSNGTLILEAENGLASGVWERRNLDGQIAMLWDNPTSNYRTIDNDESLSFNFTVDMNGTYSIALHAARVRSVMNNNDLFENGQLRTDTGNDSYVGIYDVAAGRYIQSPIKLYTGLGNVDEEFRWGKTFEVGSNHVDAEVALQAGREYRLDLIGRSDGYAIDRITFQQGTRELRDETSPESFYGDRGVAPPHGGSAGRDVETLLSGGASVPYYAMRGDDVITGSNAAEQIYGGAGNDNLMGQGGNDFIADTLGTNTLRGGGGHDVIQGGLSTTTANGDNGNDIILGGIGSDNLNGGAGNDTLRGDHRGSSFFGNDTLEGGSGRDFLEGGRGADVFVFTPNDNTNFIAMLDIDLDDPLATRAVGADFVSGIDRVDLTAFGAMSFADVQGHMTDPNGYALFSHDNTSIHFIGVDLDDLTQEDFILL